MPVMRIINANTIVLLVIVLSIASSVATASIKKLEHTNDVKHGPGQLTQLMVKRAPARKLVPNPLTLESVPEQEEMTHFKTREEVEADTRAAKRYDALMRQVGLVETRRGAVMRASAWLRGLPNRWQARYAAWKEARRSKQIQTTSVKSLQNLSPAEVRSTESVVPDKTLHFTSEEIRARLHSASLTDDTQFFDFNSLKYASRTDGTKIPVVRLDTYKDDVFNAVAYADGIKKHEPVYFAFNNGQTFKALPRQDGDFDVEPVEDASELSQVQKALSKPPIVRPPRLVRFDVPPSLNDRNPPVRLREPADANVITPHGASSAPVLPLSDEDKVKQAFLSHTDTRIARYFDWEGLKAAPRTATGIAVIKYETLDDPIVNAISLLAPSDQTAYLIGPNGKIVYVTRQSGVGLSVRMVRDTADINEIRQVLVKATDRLSTKIRVRPISASVHGSDLYPVRPDKAALAAEKTKQPPTPWWDTVAGGARNLLGKVNPSLRYIGHT